MNRFTNDILYTLASNNSNGTDDEGCMLINPSQNVIITGAYNGIPQTLILNLIAWSCLIVLFSVLRRTAWNYGRMALVQRSKSMWTNLFYRRGDGETLVDRRRNNDESVTIDEGFFTWLPAVFRLNREQILAKCGPDAVHYLSFQRHAITLMFIVTLVSICIILPINFSGTNLNVDASTFSRTTLSNLNGSSYWLWVHTLLSISFLPVSVLIMRRCTGRKPVPTSMTGTIMISNIARADRNEATIRAYFAHNFPHIQIVDLRLAYNINKLNEVQEKREMVTEALIYTDSYFKKTGKRITVKPNWCGNELDALEYYTNEEKRLKDEAKRCRAIVLNDPLGIAFLTLPSYQLAEHVINHFTLHRGWVLSHATNPADIIWENLSVQPGVWYLKAIVVNFFLFIVLFFLTTPAFVVNLFNTLVAKPESLSKISSLIFEFLPTLLLWTMAAVMPAIVAFSDKFLSHWTKSQQNYSIMTKTVSYLLLMTLILPSLGLASAEAFVTWTLHHENDTMRWDCVFLPDKGAFFVNYVITSGFIGTVLELIRFPELFLYVWYLLQSKSKAEKSYVKKAILYEFPFGVHYAWSLAIISITMVYSLACPLIAPFGLIYLMLKHVGDKHNLYFAYGPCDMSGVGGGRIHATAVRLIRVAVLLLLVNMAAWAGLRAGFEARTIILIMASIVAFGTFLLLSPFPSCTPPAPLQEESSVRYTEYAAPVLLKPVDSPLSSTPTTPDYGASSPVTNHSYSHDPINI
ncbi:CSC1-like protein 1 [Pectinophora gossypiella]|uniref:CSC1-like protein 1 n=1 Tax=Pectinophora gossypiella TaxID=13191 RepID=UPI00214EB292|nr:CSC1-like protein 1 [Pectinophora gossypiella]